MDWQTIIKQTYKAGDWVRYIGLDEKQISWGGDNPEGLEIGQQYQITTVDVQNWKTFLTLEGFDGEYNSVGFKPVDKSHWPYFV